ncbi:uncharacterized protein LODBEIA_P52210 [Lodderomyces beijingensis]|uniref:CTLH domain-containing protein n=1 Tax=Lodderomyces beijingensis TaxID=1775926 RepID=A0ABP0ZW28_9ASCO
MSNNTRKSTRVASKIDRLILDYFIHQGHREAAKTFAAELNIELGAAKEESKDAKSMRQEGELQSSKFQRSPLKNISKLAATEFSDAVLKYYSSKNRSIPPVMPDFSSGSSGNSGNSGKRRFVKGYSTIDERQKIKSLLLRGHVTEAIAEIKLHFPILLDSNNLLHFKLLRLNLIEMIRSHKFSSSMEANERIFLNEVLTFVRRHLINKISNSYKLLKELEITMSLLCFRFDSTVDLEGQKELPQELRNFFNLNLRVQVFRLVNQAILDTYNSTGGLAQLAENAQMKLIEEVKQSIHKPGSADTTDDNIEQMGFRSAPGVYTGPRYCEFDLMGLENYQDDEFFEGDDEEEGEGEEDEDDDDDNKEKEGGQEVKDGDNGKMEDIKYNFNSSAVGSSRLKKDSDDKILKDLDPRNDEEMENLLRLSLESKLEKVVKLYILTEQRKVDLKIEPSKKYYVFDEFV